MDISQLFRPESVQSGITARSRKHALDIVSGLLARVSGNRLSATEAFDALVSRERLGCTALGHAVAMPHGRVPGLERSVGALLRLDTPVDFDTPDGEPVDLVFAVLVPEDYDPERDGELTALARRCSEAQFRQRLRDAAGARELHEVLASVASEDVPRIAHG